MAKPYHKRPDLTYMSYGGDRVENARTTSDQAVNEHVRELYPYRDVMTESGFVIENRREELIVKPDYSIRREEEFTEYNRQGVRYYNKEGLLVGESASYMLKPIPAEFDPNQIQLEFDFAAENLDGISLTEREIDEREAA